MDLFPPNLIIIIIITITIITISNTK